MGCQCSNIPPDLMIIQVGESEVGLLDLRKRLRAVYLLGIENETALKKELLQRLKEKNSIFRERKEQYREALLREYRFFAKSQRPIQKQITQDEKSPNRVIRFIKIIFGKSKTF
jgi:hypothetical protein